ncbi:BppU family phage baseplate upper protein [Bacillus toyonensis]|uniref:BppU family phage baseplate upper protein n=1 Tax=Bacillus toyonensis TaxID=155322 RepID=UPI00211E3CA4|nr:BppU family phage baseplate upper protein [Bacillus toyonensis]
MKTKLILDITKSRQAQLNSVITGRQGDKATVTVNVFVVDGGIPVNLTGNTIYYEGLKPNDAYVRDTSGVKMINATQGNFEYTFRPETFGVAGIGKRSYFTIEQGGTVRASTQDFGLVTLADAMTGNTMSGPYISELEELINLAQWLVDDINSRWTDINTQLTQLQNKLNGMDVVKRSGDTMIGNLKFDVAASNRELTAVNGSAELYKWIMRGTNFEFFSTSLNKGIFNYNNTTGMFNVTADTNVAKKADFYMDSAQANGNTKVLTAATDLNTVQAKGDYAGSGLVNAPEGLTGFFYVEVVRYNDVKYVKQTATTLTGGNVSRIFTRRKVNDIWEAWTETIQSTGGTIKGQVHVELENTSDRRYAFTKDGNLLWGLTSSQNSVTLFDWKNNRNVWSYNSDTNTFNLNTPNSNVVKSTGDTMTGHLNLSSNSQINYNQLSNTSSAKGFMFTDDASSTIVGGIGRYRTPTSDVTYMGWGASPWGAANSLTVSQTQLTYKNFAITTAEKDGTETPTISNATLPDSNYLLQAIRRGNTVMLKGAITVNTNATALTVATLSANYRPAGGHNVRTYVTPNAGGTPAELFINGSTGAIAFNDKAKGNRIDFCITYTVN